MSLRINPFYLQTKNLWTVVYVHMLSSSEVLHKGVLWRPYDPLDKFSRDLSHFVKESNIGSNTRAIWDEGGNAISNCEIHHKVLACFSKTVCDHEYSVSAGNWSDSWFRGVPTTMRTSIWTTWQNIFYIWQRYRYICFLYIYRHPSTSPVKE